MYATLVRQGTKYGPRYTELLKEQIKEHSGAEVRILGDQEDATDELRCGYQGWWSKLELFAPWNEHLRPCVFFDLDTYILANISDIFFEPDELWMLEDAYQKGKGQSAIMIIPKDTSDIWTKWESQDWLHLPGDQDFLRLFNPLFIQDYFEGFYSYKADNCQEKPKGRVVFFHGRPRPHETEGWAQEIWTG